MMNNQLTISDFKFELKIVLVLFVVFLILGVYQSSNPPEFINLVLGHIEDIARDAGGSTMKLFSFILINNLIAVYSVVIGGILFGISPLISSMVNGYVIGVVSGQLFADGQGGILIPGLVPHGIFELPALFLSLALGLYLGRQLIINLKKQYQNKDNSLYQNLIITLKSMWNQFMIALRYLWRTIVPLIFLAAIIESTITPYLINIFYLD